MASELLRSTHHCTVLWLHDWLCVSVLERPHASTANTLHIELSPSLRRFLKTTKMIFTDRLKEWYLRKRTSTFKSCRDASAVQSTGCFSEDLDLISRTRMMAHTLFWPHMYCIHVVHIHSLGKTLIYIKSLI